MSNKHLLLIVGIVAVIIVAAATLIMFDRANPLVAELQNWGGDAAATQTAGVDLGKLMQSGVINEDGSLAKMPTQDSEAAKLLNGLAKQLKSSGWLSLAGIDFVAGDLEALKFDTLEACQAACADNSSCKGFTYALSSHSAEGKRGGCWLKNGEVRIRSTDHYVSGLKQP